MSCEHEVSFSSIANNLLSHNNRTQNTVPNAFVWTFEIEFVASRHPINTTIYTTHMKLRPAPTLDACESANYKLKANTTSVECTDTASRLPALCFLK